MSSYFNEAIDPSTRVEVVDRVVRDLSGTGIDTIVVSGMSGVVVGAVAAIRLGVNLVIVRKPDDSTHSRDNIVGTIGNKYVVLDDFVESGATVNRIVPFVRFVTAQPVARTVSPNVSVFTDTPGIGIILVVGI